MKTVVLMAQSVNGMIATKDNETPWTESEWREYIQTVDKAGNLIIGHRTYEIMLKSKELDKLSTSVKIIVVTKNRFTHERVVVVNSPKDALDLVRKEGFEMALVGGGTTLNSSFFHDELVDELWLDIEPIIIGNGLNLFTGHDFLQKLKFKSNRQLDEGVLRVEYEVEND